MSGDDDDKPATRVVTAGRRDEWTQGDRQPAGVARLDDPLRQRRAICAQTARGDTHHRLYYGRRGTPTQWALADALTELEPGAEGDVPLSARASRRSTAALLSVLEPGDELLLVDSAYDPTRSFADGLAQAVRRSRRAIYDPLIGAGIADLIGDNTRAIFLESPGSLTFEVQDVPAIVAAAKARGVVDAARQYLGDAAAASRRSSRASTSRSSPAPNMSSAIRT